MSSNSSGSVKYLLTETLAMLSRSPGMGWEGSAQSATASVLWGGGIRVHQRQVSAQRSQLRCGSSRHQPGGCSQP